jgi:hypothetical protein
MRQLRIAVCAAGFGSLTILWNLVYVKALVCLFTLVPFRIKKSELVVYLLIYTWPLWYVAIHAPAEIHHLRALLLISGLNVVFWSMRGVPANMCIAGAGLSFARVVIVTVFVLFIGNVVFLFSGDAVLANNFTAEEVNRYRGVYPEVLGMALLLAVRRKWVALCLLPLVSAALFVATGTRGAVVFFLLTAIVSIFGNVRLLFFYLIVQALLLYPLILLGLSLVMEPEGSFLVKNQGILTLLSGYTPNGNGIQAPMSDFSPDRVSLDGFHFSAADYGFFGMTYELGIHAAVLRFLALLILFRTLKSLPDSASVKLLVVTILPFICGYGIGIDFLYSLLSLLLFMALMYKTPNDARLARNSSSDEMAVSR